MIFVAARSSSAGLVCLWVGVAMRKVYQIRYVCATRRFVSYNTSINTA
jgi:hypothetical protein